MNNRDKNEEQTILIVDDEPINRSIIAEHEGKIRFLPFEGAGAQFQIKLPSCPSRPNLSS